ncbi:hypothetical protein [Mesorhizobium sp. KR2-14]|uniref:hypothetical protein n=1 Tax=Mesorhizobium sp. KR2-14 TaxID=3156610 RepID=UPI0032B51BBC
MPSSAHQHYLAPDDMTMIERVLENAGFRKSGESSALGRDAANFLAREFQDGVTDEAGLTQALDRYIALRGTWRSPGKEPKSGESN